MDRVDVRLLGHAHDPGNIEVGLHRPEVIADHIAFVRLEAVQRESVLARIDGDSAQAKLGGGAAHADGDFAAVGDQELGESAGPAGTVGHDPR